MMEAIMSVCSDDITVKDAVDINLQKLEKKRNLRRDKLQELNAVFEDDTLAQNLKLGPVRHEFRTAGEDGVLTGKQLSEYVKSARPVPPFPFLKENLLLTQDDRERLSDVWAFSKTIKTQKNDESVSSTICAICENHLIASDLLLHCFFCKTVIHESCISTHNTGWQQDNDDTICKNCYLVNAVN